MAVLIHVRGGLLDADRRTTVDDRSLTVSHQGLVVDRRDLSADVAATVHALAHEVATLTSFTSAGPVAVDDGTTTIEIDEGPTRRTLVFGAGDDPPKPVWDLLDAVDDLIAP